MESSSQELVNQPAANTEAADAAAETPWDRCVCDYINPVMNRIRRRPLFQKVVIANTALIAAGSIMGYYLEVKYFEGGDMGFVLLFIFSGLALCVLINYLLVKMAFRPMDDVSDAMKAIRAGHRGIRVPEVTDDPQIEELSKSLNSMLNSMEKQRKKAAASVIKAQEEERKRIARELHDEVSQSLTALLYEAEDGLEMDHGPASQKRLQSICDLTQHTLDNIHKLIFDLRPSMLDQLGLVPALRWLAETRLESRGVRVSVNARSHSLDNAADTHRLSPEIETTLYRVVQEAINNIARHAAARNVEISLDLDDEIARVSVIDDGLGFDLTELNTTDVHSLDEKGWEPDESTRGLGIIGMQERIELLGGEMEIMTAPGNGTQIHIHVPLRERSLAYD